MALRAAIAAFVLTLFPCSEARAYTVESVASPGCHEAITEAALRSVRAALPRTAAAIAPDAEERALIDDLPFSAPDDMRDAAAASLLVGVRDNDLEGRSPRELDQLQIVESDPATQQKHCLRSPTDDEPTGSVTALARCKGYIHDQAMLAIAALDANGVPDPGVRQDIDVWLSLRGRVTASLPAFWVRIGQAMHALQDAFAHTYRTADGSKVTTVLNWVDWVNGTLVESRDGPPHESALDQCDDADPIITRNRVLATQASVDLLTAALDPALDVAQKSDAIDALLEKYLDYQPGCTAENGWCDAPEEAYGTGCGCTSAGAGGGGELFGLLAFVAVGLVARRRRRARIVGAGAALLAASVPSVARAQPPNDPPIWISSDLGASVADPALAQSIGLRVMVGPHFVVGADAELNEWYGIDGDRFAAGAANFYATGVLRFPLRCEPLALRTTFQLGTAYELVALYGVPSGSVGFFGGIYPLGLEWTVAPRVRVLLDPLGVALPVPHLVGTPFVYPQFRTQVGVEIHL